MSAPTPAPARSVCPLDCPDACSLEVRALPGGGIAIDAGPGNPLTAGYICGKVRGFGRRVHGERRLRTPLVRDGAKGTGAFRRASWDEALALVVREIEAALARRGGEAVLPLAYGGSNGKLSDGLADERLFRRLGASRLLRTVCAAPTGAAAEGLYGRMPGVAFEDYERARAIVIWGANPPASGIHLVPHVRAAQRGGAALVVVDPRRTKLAKRADLHLALRPGTDLPLALAVIGWLFDEGRADLAFLAEHATGVERLRERARAWPLERAAHECGVEARDIERFARLYADANPAVVRCGWGLERNRNGGSAAAAVLALPAVAGKFGVHGGGYTLSNGRAWRLADAVRAPQPPTRAIDMNKLGRVLLEERDPPVEVLFVYDANPLATLPDQERVRRGLARPGLFTVVFDQVLTDTALWADVVLPATTFLEHDELRVSYGGYGMQLAGPAIERVGEARPNGEVFRELARRLGLERPGDPRAPDEELRALFADDPAALAALERDGIAFPAFGERPVQFADVWPGTADRRVHLVPAELEREAPGGLYAYRPDPGTERFPLALISPCTEQRISSSLGELVPGLVALHLHPADARARGIADGERVRAWNELGEVRTLARVDPDLRPGVALLPKGLWSHNTENGSTGNALVPDTSADLALGATFNDARIEVERLGGMGDGGA